MINIKLNSVVGYICFNISYNKHLFVTCIEIFEEFRRQKLGTLLFESFYKTLNSITGITTVEGDSYGTAVKFWESIGAEFKSKPNYNSYSELFDFTINR